MIERVEDLGFLIKQYRENIEMTQEELAGKCGRHCNRSNIAHLEQGRRLPPAEIVEAICTYLKMPRDIWAPFSNEKSTQRHEFEASLSELTGTTVGIHAIDTETISAAESAISNLFDNDLTLPQSFDALNSILVFYGVSQVQKCFFYKYFAQGAFQSVSAFQEHVEKYQSDAIRLFATFSEAFRRMNSVHDLDEIMEPLSERRIESYQNRTTWEDQINTIPDDRLPYLGYISVARYKLQLLKRKVLSGYLTDLASDIRQHGSMAVNDLSEKKRRKLDSLLKELDSTIQHTPLSPLFMSNPLELEKEASRILKSEDELEAMEDTQSEALSNLCQYLTADNMDVYVATSMRTDSDFISVNKFVLDLFRHRQVAPLKLRYFNPTQSWIEDRVAKGLVEALMLRRADYTIYMAQKSDTFGKDSEASVALGQGKPVIVYVPKLRIISTIPMDSEDLIKKTESDLRTIIQHEGNKDDKELDDTLDHRGLFTQALAIRLRNLPDDDLIICAKDHAIDFGLLDEAYRIKGENAINQQENFLNWVSAALKDDYSVPFTEQIRKDLIEILVALTVNFESRARIFREVHPLALQVILSSGVLNGILVVRSVESCAEVLRALVENKLVLDLVHDEENYRLVERLTGSTIRVISRNNLLINAFDAFYKSEGEDGGLTKRWG